MGWYIIYVIYVLYSLLKSEKVSVSEHISQDVLIWNHNKYSNSLGTETGA